MDMFSYLSSIDDFIKQQGDVLQDPTQPNISQNNNNNSLLNHMWLEDLMNEGSNTFGQPQVRPTAPASTTSQTTQKTFVRKKAGRKPNPATPALRKEQNRAAQRAFRERKERHIENLETTIQDLRSQLKETNKIKKDLEISKVENWYLKGVMLTLQLVCMEHNINVPTHAPYLSDQELHNMRNIDSYAKEAYVNSHTRNNDDLKSYFANARKTTTEIKEDLMHSSSGEDELEWIKKIDESDDEKITSNEPIPHLKDEELPDPLNSSLDGIHYIQMKLSVRQFIPNESDISDQAAARLRPSLLQAVVPHDPRIDLIPTQHMRDRIILFRNQMDYDRCFGLIINGAKYCGGDPTKSDNWQLPSDFYREFWFLSLNYQVEKIKIAKTMDVSPNTDPNCPLLESHIVNWSGRLISTPSTTTESSSSSNFLALSDMNWNERAVDAILRNIPNLYQLYNGPLQSMYNDEDSPNENNGLISYPVLETYFDK